MDPRSPRRRGPHRHADGHAVALRALPDHDALFDVDFNPSATKAE
ncbi:hypothetical protein ACIF8T_27605 [Streptomyces sp. NPDC085946]